MIRSPFKVALILVAVLMIVCIGAKAVGTLQPPNPALRGFVEGCEGKPQPCWYGIVPAKTMVNEAKQLVRNYGLEQLHENSAQIIYHDQLTTCYIELRIQEPVKDYFHIVGVTLFECPMVRLGDILLLWGHYERFRNGIIFNDASAVEMSSTLPVPNMSVWYISPLDASRIFSMIRLHDLHRELRYKWHGFVAKWRYCQFEPDYPDCPN